MSFDRAAGAATVGACCLSIQPAFTGGFFGDGPSIATNLNLYGSDTIMKKSARKQAFLATLAGLILLAGCATQNEVTSLDTRLNDLELRNAELKKRNEALNSGLAVREDEEQALRHQSASLRAKLAALDEEIRVLNGRIEELEHRLDRQKQMEAEGTKADTDQIEGLAKRAKSNNERINRIEQYLNFEPSAQKEPVQKSTEKTTATIIPAAKTESQISEDEIYRLAKQAFDQGDSDAARQKFQELIEKYPRSERADNAQFWIGEIYYREKWYEKAILEYQKVIETYPKGNKVPASLLKQGLAFLNLGDRTNSRLILEELIKKHPKSNEAKIARDKVKSLK